METLKVMTLVFHYECKIYCHIEVYNDVVWMGKFIYELSIRFQPEGVSSVPTLRH